MTKRQEAILDWIIRNGLESSFSQFLLRPDAFTRLAVGLGGWGWEDELRDECLKRKLDWVKAPGESLPYDSLVNGIRVQCKATCDKNRFDLRRRHDRRYEAGAFDVLALKVMSPAGCAVYIVPTTKLIDPKNPSVLLSSIAIERLAAYRDDWSVFAGPEQDSTQEKTKLKVLCIYTDCGPSYVRTGWGRVFAALGHEFIFWRPEKKPAFDAFREFEPDLFIGTTYDLDRATFKCIQARPHMKVALYASAWGKLADEIPEDDYPITRVRHGEKVTITTLKATCGKPDFVFSHVTDRFLDGVLGGWREAGVEPAGILNAADTFAYLGGARREEFACDVAFVGGYWPYKARNLDRYLLPLCDPSLGLRVKIFGNQPWPVVEYLGVLDDEDQRDVLASATVCPNVSEPHSTEFGYDIVERPFKVLAAGGFCLSDRVAAMSEVFPEGTLVQALNDAEFRDYVRYYVAHPEERLPLMEQGRGHVLANHTYFHRVAQMLRLLGYEDEAVRCLDLHQQLVVGVSGPNVR